MNNQLLVKHIKKYPQWINAHAEEYQQTCAEHQERTAYYQGWTAERLRKITQDELYEYFVRLWALRCWGNKEYVVNKLIEDNTLPVLRNSLTELLWGAEVLEKRWDKFRKEVKGIGPALMSELLCHIHPDSCLIWNNLIYRALNYLGVENTPRHYYQFTGKKYLELCTIGQAISRAMKAADLDRNDLLFVNYFIWQELRGVTVPEVPTATLETTAATRRQAPQDNIGSLHNEIRDKLRNIGSCLGFTGKTEVMVADGAKVDTVWEAQIGNMGRVIYVFEVQTRGSIDSLMVNLMKSLNNPAVQGVVAVSDKEQLEKIKRHAAALDPLKKLKYWDYEEVLRVHDALELVNESINALHLVPDSFFS